MITGTIGIGAAPQKTKQRRAKTLQTASLCYSIAKSTLTVPLTFIKLETTKHENFHFLCLLSSSPSRITQNYMVCANIMHTK